MTFGSRLSEFGIAGAVFISCQFAVLFTASSIFDFSFIDVFYSKLQKFDSTVSGDLITILSGLLSAIAIISVFFVGMAISLSGAIWVVWEIGSFKKNMEFHTDWLEPLFKSLNELAKDDRKRILTQYGENENLKNFDWKLEFKFWKQGWTKRQIAQWREMFEGLGRFRLVPAYSRLQSLFVSIIAFSPGGPTLDVIFDEMRLWQITRALSTALCIVSIEIIIVGFLYLYIDAILVFFIFIIFGFFLYFFSLHLSLGAYRRFSNALFAHLYASARTQLPSTS